MGMTPESLGLGPVQQAALQAYIQQMVQASVVEAQQQMFAQMTMVRNDLEYSQGVLGQKRCWQERGEDNVDAADPLTFDVYIPTDTKVISRVFLRLKLMAFRSYAQPTVDGLWSLNPAHFLPADFMDNYTHSHNVPDGTVLSVSGGGTVTFHQDVHSHGMTSVYHTHNMTYGIYTGATAAGVTVKINGTDRTAALGGPFNADQNQLDITDYLTPTGWNTIALGASGLGRIHATLFVEIFLP